MNADKTGVNTIQQNSFKCCSRKLSVTRAILQKKQMSFLANTIYFYHWIIFHNLDIHPMGYYLSLMKYYLFYQLLKDALVASILGDYE